MSLLVVGSIAFDSIETPVSKVEEAIGGSSVYISIAASYFHKKINLVGVVGSDFSEQYITMLQDKGIDTDGIQIINGGKTFRWSGKYHNDMNNRDTIYTHLNVFESFNPIIPPNYRNPRLLMLGNIDPVLQLSVLNQIKRPKLVVCDTMNFWIEGKPVELRETLKLVDILIINESEAKSLSQENNHIKAGKQILKMGPNKIIIKKGEHGAILVSDDFIFSAPAFPLETVVDPTGAGDTFAGGFIGYLSKVDLINEENLRRALIYGSVMASFCVEDFSINGLMDLNYLKIHDRFMQFYNLTHFEEN